MSEDKAKDFLEYLLKNPEVAEKMKGFTREELAKAGEKLKTHTEYKVISHFFETEAF